jgi:hypothetical protein
MKPVTRFINYMEKIGGYTLAERLEMTIGNIKFQKNKVFWDDLVMLEMILGALKNKEDK